MDKIPTDFKPTRWQSTLAFTPPHDLPMGIAFFVAL